MNCSVGLCAIALPVCLPAPVITAIRTSFHDSNSCSAVIGSVPWHLLHVTLPCIEPEDVPLWEDMHMPDAMLRLF